MSYCFKPTCIHPQNPECVSYCLSCGSDLLLQKRYCALKPIGQGGFGRTILAVDESQLFKPRCVVKQFLFQDHRVNERQKAAELFHQEVLQLEALGKHPQIPQLLDYFEQDGKQYLVQEFIDGQNLEQELAESGAFNESQIRNLLSDLLPVLQFVHDRQVIHRDIKPTNIIRRYSNGQLVLVDFGAAKHATGKALAQTGTIIGSAEYAAPEQTRGKAVFASDLYSLGVTCIHLLTQIPPFDVFDSSEDAWVWRCYLGFPVSESLGQILDKLLQNATKRRYQSAQAVLIDLHFEPTQVMIKSLLSVETVSRTDIERLSNTDPVKPADISLPATSVFSVAIFNPKTQSWHRLPNFFEHLEPVWEVAAFSQLQVTSSSLTSTDKITPQVTSEIVPSERRERLWSVLESIWLITIGVAILICLASGLGLNLKQYSPAVKVQDSPLKSIEDNQFKQPLLNLSSTSGLTK